MRDGRTTLGLLLLTFGVYALLAGGHTYSSDEEALFITTEALVERRSPAVEVTSENVDVLPARQGRNGSTVTIGGLGQSVVAVPFYLLGSAAGVGIRGEVYGDHPERLFVGWTGSVLTGLGVGLVFLTTRRFGADRNWAVILSLVYAFGTFAFAHAKTSFSEPLAVTLALASLYALLRAADDRSVAWAAWSGLSIGFALHARASMAVFVPVLAVFLAWVVLTSGASMVRKLGTIAAFGIGVTLPLALLFVSNWWRFGDATDFGYPSVRLQYPILEGLYGLFLSPGKSVLLYAPVVALGLLTPFFVPQHQRRWALLSISLGLVNAIFFARFVHWHGDHSYGPRYLVLSLPFWVVPLGAMVGRPRWRRAVLGSAVVGGVVSLLGVVMYFNQYFFIAERESVATLEILPDGPNYWRELHFDPKWSPVLGHARAIPSVVSNSWARLDGRDPALSSYPATTSERYGWHFSPPQMDSWIYWTLAKQGPKRFLVLAPLLLLSVAVGARLLLPRPRGAIAHA